MSQYKVVAATGQHIGDRQEQHDRIALFAAPKAPGYMMAVLAHGLGSGADGALAADQVIHTARQTFGHFSPRVDDVEAMLKSIGHEAHAVIKLSSFSSKKYPQSTMVIMVLTPEDGAFWAHVGDARLYRFDGPNFAGRTSDHSDGDTPDESADDSYGFRPIDETPRRRTGLLLNVIGTGSSDLFVTVNRHHGLKAGDAFLLCTAGLWQYFDDTELGAAIAMNSPRDAAEMLIRKARERAEGGDGENCSLAVVKLTDLPKEEKKIMAGKVKKAN